MLKPLAICALTLAAIGGAAASSDDAWAEFAAEVETGCLAATNGIFTAPSAVVDPFGTESYGLAIISGEFPSGGAGSIVCVFDKETQAVQVGSELSVTITPAAAQ